MFRPTFGSARTKGQPAPLPSCPAPRACLVAISTVAIFLANCLAIGQESRPPSAAPPVPKVIPWLEVNAPMTKVGRWFPDARRRRPDATMRDYALEGIAIWAQVTDTIIVSSRPNRIHTLYPYLMDEKPEHVRIVGGLKTFNLPGGRPGDPRPYDFADPDGWHEIADHARDVARMTGRNIVLLDNETTLERFTRGDASIDLDRLQRSLSALRETGIVFWWNLPRILDNTKAFPDRRRKTEALVDAIHEALPTAVFLDGYTAWYDADPNLPLRELMIQRVGSDHMQQRHLVTPDGFMHYPHGRRRRCFTPQEAVRRIRRMDGRPVNVYPGGAFWVSVAEQFVDAWKKTAPP